MSDPSDPDRASLATPRFREAPQPAAPAPDAHRVRRRALRRFLVGVLVLGALLFVPAGTLAYWPAWVYLGVLVLAACGVVLVAARRDPAFLERRLRVRERERSQRVLMGWGSVAYVALYVVPGLDWRFGWSSVPAGAVLAADGLALAAYAFVAWVFRVNRFAGRTIQVDEGQRLVSSGPYARVRHPMYLGVLVLMSATPVALASWWGLLAVVPVLLVLVLRIRDEERVLVRDLPGYDAYLLRTPYRLLPGIW